MSEEAVQVYIDGASSGNPGPAGCGAVFLDRNGKPVLKLRKYLGETTNNVAEYSALLCALQEAQARGWRRLAVKSDSELLVKQFAGSYRVRNQGLRPLYEKVKEASTAFDQLSIEHVRREFNTQADRLAREAVARRSDR